jgi:hypothetical protein
MVVFQNCLLPAEEYLLLLYLGVFIFLSTYKLLLTYYLFNSVGLHFSCTNIWDLTVTTCTAIYRCNT